MILTLNIARIHAASNTNPANLAKWIRRKLNPENPMTIPRPNGDDDLAAVTDVRKFETGVAGRLIHFGSIVHHTFNAETRSIEEETIENVKGYPFTIWIDEGRLEVHAGGVRALRLAMDVFSDLGCDLLNLDVTKAGDRLLKDHAVQAHLSRARVRDFKLRPGVIGVYEASLDESSAAASQFVDGKAEQINAVEVKIYTGDVVGINGDEVAQTLVVGSYGTFTVSCRADFDEGAWRKRIRVLAGWKRADRQMQFPMKGGE